jgi:hypothetical protein
MKGTNPNLCQGHALLCWQLLNLTPDMSEGPFDSWRAEGRKHHWLPLPGFVPSQLKSSWPWAPANLGVWCKACSGVQVTLTVPGGASWLLGDAASFRPLIVGYSMCAFSKETLKSQFFLKKRSHWRNQTHEWLYFGFINTFLLTLRFVLDGVTWTLFVVE